MIFEKEGQTFGLAEFEALTQVRFLKALEFDDNVLEKVSKKMGKLQMSIRQMWYGRYFEKELTEKPFPDVAIRWIDDHLGWGVFAARDFKSMEFIAEYVGFVRKKKRADRQNSYCFEYALTPEESTDYTIDAMEQGGVSRYINHSSKPNLHSSLATLNGITHVIFHTNRPIQAGEQLCYDYGPDYWAKRKGPVLL